MAYHVDITERAARDLKRLYQAIDGGASPQVHAWFNGLERLVLSLDEHPARGAAIPEHHGLRQLIYGRRPNAYRVIYKVDETDRVVTIVHIRHGRRDAIRQNEETDHQP